MSLSVGIVGLPNVGKSTLFNALTKKQVECANYPFCTIDPSVGVVEVPDERIWKLSEFSQTKKTVPAIVEFTDIAGLVKGASEGEGLGNQFLSHIRETDAIGQMVRIFDDGSVTHVDGKIDPLEDINTINLELILADAQTIAGRKSKNEKDRKRGDKEAVALAEFLDRLDAQLSDERLISEMDLSDDDTKMLRGLNLLTAKPIMYILNKKSGSTNLDELKDERWDRLMNFLNERNAIWTIVDAKVEQDLSEFEGDEKEMFREELGADDDGVSELITKAYALLNLISFFTTGEAETRAWTIKKGSTAPQAGAAIHTDFEEKFIKADIIPWDQLLEVGSYGVAREKGLLRMEGKDYIMNDGDVVEFKVGG